MMDRCRVLIFQIVEADKPTRGRIGADYIFPRDNNSTNHQSHMHIRQGRRI